MRLDTCEVLCDGLLKDEEESAMAECCLVAECSAYRTRRLTAGYGEMPSVSVRRVVSLADRRNTRAMLGDAMTESELEVAIHKNRLEADPTYPWRLDVRLKAADIGERPCEFAGGMEQDTSIGEFCIAEATGVAAACNGQKILADAELMTGSTFTSERALIQLDFDMMRRRGAEWEGRWPFGSFLASVVRTEVAAATSRWVRCGRLTVGDIVRVS